MCLCVWKMEGLFYVRTDSIDWQVGFVLLDQEAYESTYPICYWYMSLDQSEKDYERTKREFIAVLSAVLR